MNDAREKLVRWLEANPDTWLTQSYTSIGKEVGISSASVDRYLPELIADRDGIMPSEVLQQRKKAGLGNPGRSKANQDKIRQVIADNPGAHVRDIAYLAKCHPRAVQRVLKAIEQESEESQSSDNRDDVRDIDAEIVKLQKRRDALSKN